MPSSTAKDIQRGIKSITTIAQGTQSRQPQHSACTAPAAVPAVMRGLTCQYVADAAGLIPRAKQAHEHNFSFVSTRILNLHRVTKAAAVLCRKKGWAGAGVQAAQATCVPQACAWPVPAVAAQSGIRKYNRLVLPCTSCSHERPCRCAHQSWAQTWCLPGSAWLPADRWPLGGEVGTEQRGRGQLGLAAAQQGRGWPQTRSLQVALRSSGDSSQAGPQGSGEGEDTPARARLLGQSLLVEPERSILQVGSLNSSGKASSGMGIGQAGQNV